MSSVDKIKWAMSLRDPQYEALKYFDAISSKMDYRTVSKAEVLILLRGLVSHVLWGHVFIICIRQKDINIFLFLHKGIKSMTRCAENLCRDTQSICLKVLRLRWEDQRYMTGKITYRIR